MGPLCIWQCLWKKGQFETFLLVLERSGDLERGNFKVRGVVSTNLAIGVNTNLDLQNDDDAFDYDDGNDNHDLYDQ